MVSTDGSALTPDDQNPEKQTPSDEQIDRVPESDDGIDGDGIDGDEDDSDAIVSSNGNANGSTNGTATIAPRGLRKRKQKKQKKSRIDRLVMEFQPDAVEIEHRKVAGGMRWTLYVVILLLVSTIAWATWAEVDRVVVANGKIVTTSNPVVISAATTAPINSIDAKFGQRVAAGDVLATLDPTFTQAEVAMLEESANGLEAKLERLSAEQTNKEFVIAGHETDKVWLAEQQAFIDRRHEYDAKIDEFAAEKRKIEAQKQSFHGQIDDLQVRQKIRRKMYETVKNLKKKNFTETELLQHEQELSYLKQQLNTAIHHVTESDAEIESLGKRKLSFAAGTRSKISVELAETLQKFKAAKEELNKARQGHRMVTLVVPDDLGHNEFVVTQVVDRKSVVKAGEPIVRLVPIDNTTYEAEVKVPGKDVGRILENDIVDVKLTSWPYMKHGTLKGIVRKISEDSTEEGEAPAVQSYYMVRVELTDTRLKNVPDSYRLMPGMTTIAEIKVGRRRVIDYFLYPLFRSLDTSIREP